LSLQIHAHTASVNMAVLGIPAMLATPVVAQCWEALQPCKEPRAGDCTVSIDKPAYDSNFSTAPIGNQTRRPRRKTPVTGRE